MRLVEDGDGRVLLKRRLEDGWQDGSGYFKDFVRRKEHFCSVHKDNLIFGLAR